MTRITRSQHASPPHPYHLPRPLTLRVPSLQLFAIVVFATITAEGYINTEVQAEEKCIFNDSDSACSYGVGIGVLAFLACIAFLFLDGYLPRISNANERKYIVMADLIFSGESEVLLLCADRKKEPRSKTGSVDFMWFTQASVDLLIHINVFSA